MRWPEAWFPRKDSNLRSRIQSPLPYRLATRDRLVTDSLRRLRFSAAAAAPQHYANRAWFKPGAVTSPG